MLMEKQNVGLEAGVTEKEGCLLKVTELVNGGSKTHFQTET